MKTWFAFILKNFAVPIIFFIVFNGWGPKLAIALAICVTVLQLFGHQIFQVKSSPFFIVSSFFTVSLGSIDLVITSPQFFRLEPFIHNFLIGTLLLFTLFARLPVVEWFINALPDIVRPRSGELSACYLQRVMLIWIVYFYLKSVFYLYLASHVNLGELIILRTLIGSGSMVALFAGELIYRRLRQRRA